MDTAGSGAARRVANWYASVVTDVEAADDASASVPTDSGTSSSAQLIALNAMVEANEVSGSTAKELFARIIAHGQDYNVRKDAIKSGMIQVSDEGEIAKVVDEVLADPASAASITDIKAGKDKAIGYLVGQVMKKSGGKANPALAQKLLRQKL